MTTRLPSSTASVEAASPANAVAIRPLFLDVHDAGIALGVSRSTVYDLMNQGQLKGVKVATKRLIPVAEIERFARDLIASQAA